MTRLNLEVSDELAARIRPLGAWLSVVLELSLAGFRTLAAATAAELIDFLSHEPSPQEVLAYHASERARDVGRHHGAGGASTADSLSRLPCTRMSPITSCRSSTAV